MSDSETCFFCTEEIIIPTSRKEGLAIKVKALKKGYSTRRLAGFIGKNAVCNKCSEDLNRIVSGVGRQDELDIE